MQVIRQWERVCVSALLLVIVAGTAAHAETAAEMQKRLNAEVLSSEFDPGDLKKAEAYADDALKKNIKPVQAAPSYWQPGWTCGNLTRYRYYRYRDYRDCIYYHRYYGHYW